MDEFCIVQIYEIDFKKRFLVPIARYANQGLKHPIWDRSGKFAKDMDNKSL